VNPFVFIVGAPRSGTTLLRRIVDAHPDVAITKETHWIVQLLRGEHAASTTSPVTPELLARLLSHRRFARLELDPARLESLVAADEPVSYAELVTAVYDSFGEMRGKRLVGDKTPRYVRHIPTLHGLWPGAKFVHLIRDGRDVCLSVRNWDKENRFVTRISTFEEDPISTIALWWEQLVRLGREDGASLSDDLYYELRYEHLVATPDEECRKLCSFLGVPYSDRMLRFHEGRTRDEPGLDAKSAWRPITPGLRNWRTEMADADVERFETVAGGLLDELDYPRGAPEPGPAARERAARVRESYAREAGRQRVPQAWGV
jgi:sulfotransferase family protein